MSLQSFFLSLNRFLLFSLILQLVSYLFYLNVHLAKVFLRDCFNTNENLYIHACCQNVRTVDDCIFIGIFVKGNGFCRVGSSVFNRCTRFTTKLLQIIFSIDDSLRLKSCCMIKGVTYEYQVFTDLWSLCLNACKHDEHSVL